MVRMVLKIRFFIEKFFIFFQKIFKKFSKKKSKKYEKLICNPRYRGLQFNFSGFFEIILSRNFSFCFKIFSPGAYILQQLVAAWSASVADAAANAAEPLLYAFLQKKFSSVTKMYQKNRIISGRL
jgi:hypothetical protein